jgi:hypothetical protein
MHSDRIRHLEAADIGIRCARALCGAVLGLDDVAHVARATGRPYCTPECHALEERPRESDTAALLQASFRAVNALRLLIGGLGASAAAQALYELRRKPSELDRVAHLHRRYHVPARDAARFVATMGEVRL